MNTPPTSAAEDTAGPQALWFLRNLAVIHAPTSQTSGQYTVAS